MLYSAVLFIDVQDFLDRDSCYCDLTCIVWIFLVDVLCFRNPLNDLELNWPFGVLIDHQKRLCLLENQVVKKLFGALIKMGAVLRSL